jgi:NAD(P)-dependent dehydrogenase (short-subunit alcohol dehydrogenase family)
VIRNQKFNKGKIMKNMLEGKVAVVTGSGGGIGRAEALAMAKQGAKVVVNDIGTSYDGQGVSNSPADAVVKEIKAAGGIAVASYASVAVEKEAESIIQTAIDNFGRIDILVNNAGVIRDPHDIYEVTTDDWDITIKTHLYGVFFCSRHACKYMKKQGYGRIINTSSHTAFGWRGFTYYSAVKEGIAGFTRTLARDMVDFGVTANAIRPLAAWRGSKELSPAMALNSPEDIAVLVAYLASEQAGQINGRVFEVWHGHVGIFAEPPPVQEVIKKKGSFTIDELAEMMPQTLAKGLSAAKFAPIMSFGRPE